MSSLIIRNYNCIILSVEVNACDSLAEFYYFISAWWTKMALENDISTKFNSLFIDREKHLRGSNDRVLRGFPCNHMWITNPNIYTILYHTSYHISYLPGSHVPWLFTTSCPYPSDVNRILDCTRLQGEPQPTIASCWSTAVTTGDSLDAIAIVF